MPTYVALLRGVNVTGHNKLPMAELRSALSALGWQDVRTYVQSGNVVLRTRQSKTTVRQRLAGVLDEAFDLRPNIVLLTAAEFDHAIDACPYSTEAEADPRKVHVYFLGGRPAKPALEDAATRQGPDRFELRGTTLYLHTPNGYGKSKAAELLLNEKKLGVSSTARNWRTALAVQALAADLGS